MPVLHLNGSSIFVGSNLGEWGGGLQRVDRNTKAISTVEKKVAGEICGQPLDTKCDPITGIATIPWKPECVAATIGLQHMGTSHGRVIEVCGDNVEVLHSAPIDDIWRERRSGASSSSDPFYGLFAKADRLWAIGIDGVHRIGPGATDIIPFPKFEQIGDVQVSFELPDFVLLQTDINQRRSVGGSAPMAVPR